MRTTTSRLRHCHGIKIFHIVDNIDIICWIKQTGVLNVIAPFIKLEDELIFVGMMYKHISGLTAMPVKYFTFESSWNI